MLKAKILREDVPGFDNRKREPQQNQPTPQQAAPAQPQPAPAQPTAPAQQPDQKQVLQQATEAIKQIVMPIITQTLNEYFQKTFPGVLQNALKGQAAPAAPAKQPAAPAAPAPAAAPVKK